MTETRSADVVVAGAGHNALIAAAYLARAGKSVLVVDARPIPGGGVATEEYLPGYFMDSCSTGHTIIQGNPVIKDDTLGLVRDRGLAYVDPDPVARVAFPDGEQIGMHLDPAATHAQFARFSARDADRYLDFLADWEQAKVAFSKANNTPIGWGPSLDQLLDGLPNGGVWRRRRALSAWDVIRHEFTEEHVQAFLLWEACQTSGPSTCPVPGSCPLLDHGRTAAAQLDDPPGRLRPAAADAPGRGHRGARRASGRLRHGGLAAPAGRRQVCGRGIDRRPAVPRHRGRAVHDPCQAPDRHGARRCVGGLLPPTGWRRTTSASRFSPSSSS